MPVPDPRGRAHGPVPAPLPEAPPAGRSSQPPRARCLSSARAPPRPAHTAAVRSCRTRRPTTTSHAAAHCRPACPMPAARSPPHLNWSAPARPAADTRRTAALPTPRKSLAAATAASATSLAAGLVPGFPTEDARGYFRLLHRLLRRFGVPLSFYGDRHGIFVRNDDHWSVEEQLADRRKPTQFGRALDQLGMTYIAAQSPQAKGRIERLWGTFQDRLTSELRLGRCERSGRRQPSPAPLPA